MTCDWEGCERLATYAHGTDVFCSLHHPAGRAHIEARDERIAELEASCEQWARRVDELKAELDKVRKDFGYEQQMRWHLRSELDTWMRKGKEQT